ncbi:hypothetical protein QJQ45_023962, partial [Haematococcus lacustris]
VAYLTIVQFLDKRQELEDQGQLKTSITGLPADKEVSKDSSEGEKRLSLRKAMSVKKDTSKGFGELLSPTALGDVKVTRRFKRKFEEIHHVVDDHGHAGEHGHEKEAHVPKVKNINVRVPMACPRFCMPPGVHCLQVIELGRWEMDTWYHSPYPEPYASQDKLYVCEFSLKYFRKKKTLIRHLAKLDIRHPPGDEIYRSPPPPPSQPSYAGGAVTNPPISVFEVDGKKAKVYCQNLCLLSKLFLDHKTLYYDVDPFLFYVLCERDTDGYHIGQHLLLPPLPLLMVFVRTCRVLLLLGGLLLQVGYFSKEKECKEEYNLACILTLPAYQRKGYGKLLIAFAYELSRREGRVGTPERPLSDLGQVSFRSYWARVLLEALRHMRGDVSVKEMSEMTMIKGQDIVDTLQPITCSLARRTMPQSLGLIKYWRGTHLIHADPRIVQEHYAKHAQQRMIDVDPACLHWQPLPALNNRKRL